jgi:type VI secretion system protein ImpG
MSETLFPYYERELFFIRQLSQEFARQYPAAAGRLLLEPNRSADPHVERLIESFALLAGRIHHKLDDEFPELTDAFLNILYPHYLAPIPSMATLQFDLDPTRAQLPQGFHIARGSRLHTHAVNNLPCRFRTVFPVTLWPVKVVAARLQPPPFPADLQVPARTAAILRLQFECLAGMKFSDLSLDRLRFHLSGDNYLIPYLYELIFNHTFRVVFRSLESENVRKQVTLPPDKSLFPVGFEADEGMLPYPKRSLLGYRLLTELFTYPSKFLYFDLGGWDKVRQAGFQKQAEAVLFLNRSMGNLEQTLDESMFVQGCTPVVNLFDQVCEPILLSHTKHEYRVVPDVAHPRGVEVYSVDRVTSTDTNTATSQDFEPLYSFRHGQTPETDQTFWYASRRPSMQEEDRGTEVYLALVDLGLNPLVPPNSTVVVRATCSNRDYPSHLQLAGQSLFFELEAAAPLRRINCIRTPTTPLRPPPRRGRVWRLISHLSLNHLSLTDTAEGLDALKEILNLYDFSDPEAGQQLAAINQQMVEGLVGMQTRRVVGRVGEVLSSGFCRGIEVSLEFDEQKFIGTGVYLFASVLERFLGLYATINSFSQLVGKTTQGGVFRKWPPRAGEIPLL